MNPGRLEKQIRFLVEADKLKDIYRRSFLVNGSRKENDAEHSWHFALCALVLREYADEPDLDLLTVLKMALVHDLVEIYAGDTYIYDAAGRETQAAREREAADRLFPMLPREQAEEFRRLWMEFEEKRTKEARFAGAIDRLQPLLLNYFSGGESWREHGVNAEQVFEITSRISEGSMTLWEYARGLIREAVDGGILPG
ncbi:MAG: HD domain-containing protein [Spirochaetales bacterium]|nr:MAG: HD domain-containing protein [Spirochaetales bacterium]